YTTQRALVTRKHNHAAVQPITSSVGFRLFFGYTGGVDFAKIGSLLDVLNTIWIQTTVDSPSGLH
ncbi:MAG: hypothetical protein ACK5N9_10465, partial [Pirellula sp.]